MKFRISLSFCPKRWRLEERALNGCLCRQQMVFVYFSPENNEFFANYFEKRPSQYLSIQIGFIKSLPPRWKQIHPFKIQLWQTKLKMLGNLHENCHCVCQILIVFSLIVVCTPIATMSTKCSNAMLRAQVWRRISRWLDFCSFHRYYLALARYSVINSSVFQVSDEWTNKLLNCSLDEPFAAVAWFFAIYWRRYDVNSLNVECIAPRQPGNERVFFSVLMWFLLLMKDEGVVSMCDLHAAIVNHELNAMGVKESIKKSANIYIIDTFLSHSLFLFATWNCKYAREFHVEMREERQKKMLTINGSSGNSERIELEHP